MGLMDFMNGLDGEGLLAGGLNMMAASGPSRQPSNFGASALAGLQGYQGTIAERKKRQQMEEEARQIAQMRGLQMRDLQGGLQDRDAARQQATEMDELQRRFAQGQGGAPSGQAAPMPPMQLGSTPMNSSMGQPEPQQQAAQAPQGQYEHAMAYAQFLQKNGKVQDAMRVAKDAQALKSKVKDWREVEVNGQVMAAPYFDDGTAGQPVPMDVARKLIAVDNGQSNDMTDPFTGKVRSSMKKQMTPGEVARNNMDGAQLGQSRERLTFEKSQATSGGKAPAGYRWSKDLLSLEPIPGGPASKSAVATEGERKAATLVQRLQSSEQQMRDALDPKKGGDPKAAGPGYVANSFRGLGMDTAANVLATSPQRQRVEAAQLDILDSSLTLATGAAYTREQLEGYRKSYFPQIGDDSTTIRDKEKRLKTMIEAGRTQAGRAAPNAPAGNTSIQFLGFE